MAQRDFTEKTKQKQEEVAADELLRKLPGCGLIAGHTVPCRREQEDGMFYVLDENGESSDASKGCGQGGYKVVLRKQLKHGRAQQGRLAL